MSEPRYYVVQQEHGYGYGYWRGGEPRPSGFTVWRETEDEIRAVIDEWNARLDAPQPDTETLDLFGGAE